jgi:hypothetical protein
MLRGFTNYKTSRDLWLAIQQNYEGNADITKHSDGMVEGSNGCSDMSGSQTEALVNATTRSSTQASVLATSEINAETSSFDEERPIDEGFKSECEKNKEEEMKDKHQGDSGCS